MWTYHFDMPSRTTPARRTASSDAADRIRQWILRGEVTVGGDLPPERELASRLGVSRLTVRAAIARLTAEGLLQPMHGSGTRVLDYRQTGGVDIMGYLATLSLEGGQLPLGLLADLLELRRAIAVETIGLVAERATPGEIAELRAHVAMQAGLVGEPGFRAADIEFARMIVHATHNLALELMFNTIARALASHPSLEPAFLADQEQTIALYGHLIDRIEEHRPNVRDVARKLLGRLDRRTIARATEVARAMQGGGST